MVGGRWGSLPGTQTTTAEATPSAAVARPDHWVPVEGERVNAGRCHKWLRGVELVLEAE